jgi:hypothetical protein
VTLAFAEMNAMSDYWRFMDLDRIVYLVVAIGVLPFLTRLAYLHRKYAIPLPLPSRWPRPLPVGWRSLIRTQCVILAVAGAVVIFAGYRYFEYVGELESQGGRVQLWIGFAAAYRLAGRAGLFGLAIIIGLACWLFVGRLVWRLRAEK